MKCPLGLSLVVLLGDDREVIAQRVRMRGIRDVPLAVSALEGECQCAVSEDAAPHSLVDRHFGDAVVVQLRVAAGDAVVTEDDLLIIECPRSAQPADEPTDTAPYDRDDDQQDTDVEDQPHERPVVCRVVAAEESQQQQDASQDLEEVDQADDATDDGEHAAW